MALRALLHETANHRALHVESGKIISDSVNARSIFVIVVVTSDRRNVTHSMHAECSHTLAQTTVYSITFGMHNFITNDETTKRRTNKFQNQSETEDEILDGQTVAHSQTIRHI